MPRLPPSRAGAWRRAPRPRQGVGLGVDQVVAVPGGEPGGIERGEPAEQAEPRRAGERHNGVERFVHRRRRLFEEGHGARVAAPGMGEDEGREAAEIAGLRQAGELDDAARVVPELLQHRSRHGRAGMHAVMGQQSLLQQRVAEARAAAWSPTARPQPPM